MKSKSRILTKIILLTLEKNKKNNLVRVSIPSKNVKKIIMLIKNLLQNHPRRKESLSMRNVTFHFFCCKQTWIFIPVQRLIPCPLRFHDTKHYLRSTSIIVSKLLASHPNITLDEAFDEGFDSSDIISKWIKSDA